MDQAPIGSRAMSAAERQRKRRNRELHVTQLHRTGAAAHAFVDALKQLAEIYSRLEQEQGGDKKFAAWLKQNGWNDLDAEDRRALVALGRLKASGKEMPEVVDELLSPTSIWRWVQERRRQTEIKDKD